MTLRSVLQCCALLVCNLQCCAMLDCNLQCCAVLDCNLQCCALLVCNLQCCAMLDCNLQCCAVLDCNLQCCAIFQVVLQELGNVLKFWLQFDLLLVEVLQLALYMLASCSFCDFLFVCRLVLGDPGKPCGFGSAIKPRVAGYPVKTEGCRLP